MPLRHTFSLYYISLDLLNIKNVKKKNYFASPKIITRIVCSDIFDQPQPTMCRLDRLESIFNAGIDASNAALSRILFQFVNVTRSHWFRTGTVFRYIFN